MQKGATAHLGFNVTLAAALQGSCSLLHLIICVCVPRGHGHASTHRFSKSTFGGSVLLHPLTHPCTMQLCKQAWLDTLIKVVQLIWATLQHPSGKFKGLEVNPNNTIACLW